MKKILVIILLLLTDILLQNCAKARTDETSSKKNSKNESALKIFIGKKARRISQHPTGGFLKKGKKLSHNYILIDDVEHLVYSDKRNPCPDWVEIKGIENFITASKFGKKGTERQIRAVSWRCLDKKP